MLTLNTRILVCLGVALAVLLVVMAVTSNALSNKPIPPPIPDKNTETPPAPAVGDTPPPLPGPSVEVQQQPPVEPMAGDETVIPPLPPPPPSEHLNEDALRELDHAYQEITMLERIIDNLQGKMVFDSNILELWNKTLGFYDKAYQLYNDGDYIVSKVYAHLAIEGVHGLREILAYEVNEK